MKLYRGIAVPEAMATGVVDEIQRNGLTDRGTGYRIRDYNLKPHLTEFWQNDALSTRETRPDENTHLSICACGEPDGALYYAWRHNRNGRDDTPILITFDADVDDVTIDGRDFMVKLFEIGDPDRAREPASRIFGPTVLKYLDRAWASDRHERRLAMYDLASHDELVIATHVENRIVIGGRHGTTFRSAFFVRLPVLPEQILGVSIPAEKFDVPEPQITLEQVVKR